MCSAAASSKFLCCYRQGFWEERLLRLQQNQQLGPGILVFGCRTLNEYLFQTEVHTMIGKGAITDVLTAFSRVKDMPTRYVQVGVFPEATSIMFHHRSSIHD